MDQETKLCERCGKRCRTVSARNLNAQGFVRGDVFECESLTTGQVSMECIAPAFGEQPLAHVVCANGMDVTDAVQQLVRDAHSALHLAARD